MNNETRNRLRRLRDQRTRERIDRERRIKHPPVMCHECKCDHDAWTAGCRTCNIRHYGRLKRGVFPGGEAAYRKIAAAKYQVHMSILKTGGPNPQGPLEMTLRSSLDGSSAS